MVRNSNAESRGGQFIIIMETPPSRRLRGSFNFCFLFPEVFEVYIQTSRPRSAM